MSKYQRTCLLLTLQNWSIKATKAGYPVRQHLHTFAGAISAAAAGGVTPPVVGLQIINKVKFSKLRNLTSKERNANYGGTWKTQTIPSLAMYNLNYKKYE